MLQEEEKRTGSPSQTPDSFQAKDGSSDVPVISYSSPECHILSSAALQLKKLNYTQKSTEFKH
jgi:hypothetical protein